MKKSFRELIIFKSAEETSYWRLTQFAFLGVVEQIYVIGRFFFYLLNVWDFHTKLTQLKVLPTLPVFCPKTVFVFSMFGDSGLESAKALSGA